MLQSIKLSHTKRLGIICSIFYFMTGCSKIEESGWSAYKADDKSSSYSAFDQINTTNVENLDNVWTFQMDDLPKGEQPVSSQSNPIIINGTMYVNSGKQTVYALDAVTGSLKWSYKALGEGEPSAASRGVTYWKKDSDERIFYSAGNYLIALDAKTGQLITSFGENGKVYMNIGVRDDPEKISVTLTTPGRIFKDLIIIGSRLPDSYGAPPGYIRAYDCKTGALVWTFHTIPHPGEPGYESWPPDAYKYAGGVNCWAGMSIDQERGTVYLALGSPSYDFYGADRLGMNLYGNCVLALDAATGKYKWHFQTVHHDLWDYDLPAPPNLVSFQYNGKVWDAVAQVSKQGFVYVLDRDSGKPIFPIEEKPVPKSNIPGEEAWPTQPFPILPKAFVKQSITEDDLTNYSPEGHKAIVEKFRSVRYEGLFTPPDLKGTIAIPATRGGANWGGAAFDPETGFMYIRGNNLPEIQTMVDADKHFASLNNTVYEKGRSVYMQYCGACHGADRKGIPPSFPAIDNLKDTKPKPEIVEKIRRGGGQMPGFKGVITDDEERAIMAFLYEEKNAGTLLLDQDKIKESGIRYANITPYTTWSDPNGNPAFKAPWNTLSALNLSTGEYEWQIPVGNDEKLWKEGEANTGLLARSGPMVTAGGLVFISGAADKKLWAFDKMTGKLLKEIVLPGVNNANVCSYIAGGKQYIALSVGGTPENPAGSIMTFALN